MSGTTQRGRRAGGGDTRGEILAAARTSFAEAGYGGTSVRAVAAAAGVDPALVHHYFGTKDDLFLAALEFPVDPRVVLASVVEGDRETLGVRLVARALSVWDDPQARLPLLALVRSGIAGESGRTLLESALSRLIFGALGQSLDVDDSDRRVGLVASQMVGLVITRYVLRLEPMASMPAEEVAAWLGPTLQRYLTADAP
ncbi:MAG TPA: TetR family transcriptional regulator [Nocardioidaceae bacterium]|nr:TetR family transcriptional regulator [Nocardioidaceae bacterium]